MSAKLMRIEHKQKFRNINEAVKEANAVIQCANRFIKRNKISCKALVCVSEHDLGRASPSFKNDGKRGRPSKMFIDRYKEGQEAPKKKPHLHILLKSDEANKVAVKLVQNINQRYRKRNPNNIHQVVSRRYPVQNPSKYIGYVMQQGTYLRLLEHDEKRVLEDFDFQSEYESYKPFLY